MIDPMRWEWDGGYVEVVDGIATGEDKFVATIEVLVEEAFPVFTDRFYLVTLPARLDSRMNAIATVEWVARMMKIKLTSMPDISDIVPTGVVDGLPERPER